MLHRNVGQLAVAGAFVLAACSACTSGPAETVQSAPPLAPKVDRWPGLTLARSNAGEDLSPLMHTLAVSKSTLSLDDGPPIARIAPGADGGPPTANKTNSLLIEPLRDAFETLPVESMAGRSVALAFDASTPYRVVVEVLFTAGFSGISEFDFVVMRGTQIANIATHPPGREEVAARGGCVSPCLAVRVLADAITMKTKDGTIGPRCELADADAVFSHRESTYDFAALAACAAKLKQQTTPGADDVIITARPEIPWSTIVSTIDALRYTAKGEPLFANVVFGNAH